MSIIISGVSSGYSEDTVKRVREVSDKYLIKGEYALIRSYIRVIDTILRGKRLKYNPYKRKDYEGHTTSACLTFEGGWERVEEYKATIRVREEITRTSNIVVLGIDRGKAKIEDLDTNLPNKDKIKFTRNRGGVLPVMVFAFEHNTLYLVGAPVGIYDSNSVLIGEFGVSNVGGVIKAMVQNSERMFRDFEISIGNIESYAVNFE